MNPLEEAIAAVKAGDRGGRTDGGSGMATTPRPTMDPIAFHGPAGEVATNPKSGTNPANREWPTLDEVALHGPVGDAVRIIEPETEADPVAVLVTMLAGIGAMIGRGPQITRGGDHPARLFALIVGDTAKGGKGQSLRAARLVLDRLDPTFMHSRTLGGFGSGEALVDAVADPDADGNGGAPDRRLLLIEQEFTRVLRTTARDGSTLSGVIREAWDGDKLQSRSRQQTAVANNHHVAVIGHVVADELRRYLTATDAAGGFANRFLFICARRTKLLPHGAAHLLTEELNPAVNTITERIREARKVDTVEFTDDAKERYTDLYSAIETDDPGGLLGSIITRGSPYLLRLSLLYALLDGCRQIDVQHLEAGYAVWRYARASAEYVFGDSIGDEVADKILNALRMAPAGLTLTELDRALGKHVAKNRRDHALGALQRRELVAVENVETRGRPSTVVRST